MTQLLPNRLNEKIKIDEMGCWLWQGSKSKGYGYVSMCGSMRQVHRCLFELLVGTIPNGMELHHRCEKSICCNPDHLTIISAKEHRKLHPHTRRRSHCFRGHLFTAENTHIDRDGCQNCKICRRMAAQRHYFSKGRIRRAERRRWRYQNDSEYREHVKSVARRWRALNRVRMGANAAGMNMQTSALPPAMAQAAEAAGAV